MSDETSDSSNPSDDLESNQFIPPTTVVETDPSGGSTRPATDSLADGYRRVEVRESFEAHFSNVPMPAPEALGKLKLLFPDAPAVIFKQMTSQSSHRIKMEASVVETKNSLALRGQIIAAVLGSIGLVGSLVVIDHGHDWAGVAVGGGTLAGLVGLFLRGQSSQRNTLNSNAMIRAKMAKNTPIEDLESSSSDDVDSVSDSELSSDSS